MCHLPKDIYPPVYEPATGIGKVSEEAARATGLMEGTPVLTGGAGTQLALLGTENTSPETGPRAAFLADSGYLG